MFSVLNTAADFVGSSGNSVLPHPWHSSTGNLNTKWLERKSINGPTLCVGPSPFAALAKLAASSFSCLASSSACQVRSYCTSAFFSFRNSRLFEGGYLLVKR